MIKAIFKAGLALLVFSMAIAAHPQDAVPPPTAPPTISSSESAPLAEPSGASGYAATTVGQASIHYDPETGSLIIITDEETNKQIDKVVKELDKPAPQVLIKVLFLEVTHTKGVDFGLEGKKQYGTKDGTEDTIQTIFGLASETRGGFWKILDEDLEVVIRAMADTSKLEVLSRPSVLTRNNQQATITVGQEVPFIRNSRITDGGDIINTIEYEDIGIILNVTPRITENRLVEMSVSPEISTLSGETVPISNTVNARIIAKRAASTNVVVDDGRTVVIGGLMEDNATETIKKIPILGDIPYLGSAFKRTIKEKSKTELLIFLTPHVVENSEELRDISLSERDKAEISPKVFTKKQFDRYIDNLE